MKEVKESQLQRVLFGEHDFLEFRRIEDDGEDITVTCICSEGIEWQILFANRYLYQVVNESDVVNRFVGNGGALRRGVYLSLDGSYQKWLSTMSAFRNISAGLRFFYVVLADKFIEVAAFDDPLLKATTRDAVD